MKNVMVASTKSHARAMIAWLKLNGEEWEPIAYGDVPKEVYRHAKLVRPTEEINQTHSDWVFGTMLPNIAMSVTTVPHHWRIPQEHVEDPAG